MTGGGELAPVTRIPTPLASLVVCRLTEWIECDVCDREGPHVHAPSDDLVADARDAARAEGWWTDPADDLDLCPTCWRDHT